MWLNLIKSHWGDCVNLVAHVHDPSLRFSVGWWSNFIRDTRRCLEVWLAKDTILASWRITLWLSTHNFWSYNSREIYPFSWLLLAIEQATKKTLQWREQLKISNTILSVRTFAMVFTFGSSTKCINPWH